jgi:uncharacterized protein YqjF (DUF2071 family)
MNTPTMLGYTADPTGAVAHRPWPLPDAPWVMAQRWNDLLFAHWPVGTDELRALVPPKLTLDLHDETAWVSVTPFYLSHLRPRGLPAFPLVSEFAELNVRTYVTAGGKPGVYFFSLDANSALAVGSARALFHLPYYEATMQATVVDDQWISYASSRSGEAADAVFRARYRPVGEVRYAEAGSLDHWLTERYCLYALNGAGNVLRTEIHHEPWPLQPAEVSIAANTMAAAAGITLPDIEPRVSFSREIDVVIWRPEKVG